MFTCVRGVSIHHQNHIFIHGWGRQGLYYKHPQSVDWNISMIMKMWFWWWIETHLTASQHNQLIKIVVSGRPGVYYSPDCCQVSQISWSLWSSSWLPAISWLANTSTRKRLWHSSLKYADTGFWIPRCLVGLCNSWPWDSYIGRHMNPLVPYI